MLVERRGRPAAEPDFLGPRRPVDHRVLAGQQIRDLRQQRRQDFDVQRGERQAGARAGPAERKVHAQPRLQPRRQVHRKRSPRRHHQHLRRAGWQGCANSGGPRAVGPQPLLLAGLANVAHSIRRPAHEALRRRTLRCRANSLRPLQLGPLRVVLRRWKALRVVVLGQNCEDLGRDRAEVHSHVQRPSGSGVGGALQPQQRSCRVRFRRQVAHPV